jgi:hypothetical protein
MNGLKNDDPFLNKLGSSNSQGMFGEMNELDELDYDETYENEADYAGEEEDDDMMNANDYEDNEMLDDYDENNGDQMYDNENNNMTDSNNHNNQGGKKKLIRCSFWPLCEKGDACLFLHPNKPCTAFPNCQFGQLCHYVHPNCRYDGFCTRPDCPFTHNIKKGSLNAKETVAAPLVQVEQAATNVSAPLATAQDVPKVTINKIQPFVSNGTNPFSLVNKSVDATAATSTMSTTSTTSGSTLTVPTSVTATVFKSHFVPVPSGRILFPLQSSAFHHHHHHASTNQYKLVSHGTGKPTSAVGIPLPVSVFLTLILTEQQKVGGHLNRIRYLKSTFERVSIIQSVLNFVNIHRTRLSF